MTEPRPKLGPLKQLSLRLLTAIPTLAAGRPKTVVLIATALSLLSLLVATRIQVRTSFWDTMSRDEPTIARINYLASNFPSAVTVLVLLEANQPERLIEVAQELRSELLQDNDVVRSVYLEQDVDFFERHALLYLEEDELRQIDTKLAQHEPELSRLVQDPSLLGLLRAIDSIGQTLFPSQDSMVTLQTRIFGQPLVNDILAGRPAARVGVKLDTDPLQKRIDRRTLKTIRDVPMPPSDATAQQTLRATSKVFDLVADVLEQGQGLGEKEFQKRCKVLRDFGAGPAGALPERYRFSQDKKMLLMEIAANRDVTRIENIKPLLAHVNAVVDRVKSGNRDVRIGLTGMPVLYAADESAVLDNFVLVTILGLFGILAVFIIGFERIGLPSLALIPLLMGVLLTLGIQGLFEPTLNMFNLLFPVLLFGLGVDFAIHIVSGFTQERQAGKTLEQALQSTYLTVVPGLITGAITTAAAFFVLLFASLKGVRDLGFTAGIGVTMALLTMLVVLPALLALWDRKQARAGESVPHVHFAAISKLGSLLQRSRYGVLAVFLVVTIVLAYFVQNVGLERDSGKLQSQETAAAKTQQKVIKAFQMNLDPTIFFAKDLTEAERIRQAVLRSRTIGEPLSITAAIPPRQQEKQPYLEAVGQKIQRIASSKQPSAHSYDQAELAELRDRLAAVKKTVLEVSLLSEMLYSETTQNLMGDIRDSINRIDARLNSASVDRLLYLDSLITGELDRGLEIFQQMANNRSLSVADLPSSLRERVQGKDGSWMVITWANSYALEEEFLSAHVEELESIHSEVTGLIPAWKRMLDKILADLPVLTGLTLLAVAICVFLGLRSFRGTVLSLVPLLLGMLWTVGILGLLGIQFNFISVLAIPLIVGIGIDDGVHLYHRIRHEHDLGAALSHSGKPIILTSMTTGIGFGSLLLSVHRGVFYLGLTTAIGIVCCLVVSLLLLPALVAIFDEGSLTTEANDNTEVTQ